MKVISTNRKASFSYHLITKYEAGIELKGSEVKAIREGKANIKESFVRIVDNELFIIGMHIGEYSHSGYTSHEPTRTRKLLMHKSEIYKLYKDSENKGKTIIPVKLYFKNSIVKIEVALAKGKKNWDKREAKKQKDVNREIDRSMKGLK